MLAAAQTGAVASAMLDTARAVRPGEELDQRAVDAWLKTKVSSLTGTPQVTQYAGGASNWTYRLQYPSHDLILRRPPKGTKAKSAHDMGREFRVQTALAPVYPYVPKMVAYCDDPAVLGCEFYVMERIKGVIPRANLPAGLALTPEIIRKLCTNVIDRMIELHKVDVQAAGLGELGRGPGYARRQIEGWTGRYEKAITPNAARFTRVKAWLRANIPDDVGACLIHNDFRFDNVVLDPDDITNVIGVLDWEMATVGDPLMDLGNSLAYWVEAHDDFFMKGTRKQPTHLPGMLTRQEVVAYYAERMGLRADQFAVYEVYGLFRLAAIVQQIYYRYYHQQTRNPAFKKFWLLTHYLNFRCNRIIRRSRL